MSSRAKDTNMFLVHGKNGLFVNGCVPGRRAETPSEYAADADESARSDTTTPYTSVTVWSLNRFARHYARSPNNNVAIVDDRLGLSILHVKGESPSDFSFDTLRGVGKYRNLYTPIGCKNIKHLQWSNNGVYLVIYFNLTNCSRETGLFLEDNLHIWDISQKCIVGSFSTRRLSPDQWPIIKWVGHSDKFALCYGQQVSIYAITSSENTPLKSTRLLHSIPIPRVFSVEVFSPECLPDSNDQSKGEVLGTDRKGGAVPGGKAEHTSGLSLGERSGTDATTVGSFAATSDRDDASSVAPGDVVGSAADLRADTPSAKESSATSPRSIAGSESKSLARFCRGAQDCTISIAAYTKADVSSQISGNLRITTLRCVGDELSELSSVDHELKSEDSADMFWSPSGRSLLVLGQSIVDLAGEKYGSTSNCFLFRSSGDFVCQVNMQTTHDARWCPTRDEFILMEGNMPCDITLYDSDCVQLFTFPKSYRNTIKWNPLGNMVALCGFGNLAGEICFWYRKDACDYEQIVHLKEPCTVVSEWSSDSRYFMAASTFPRMKVDNFLKIFSHEGDLLESQKFDECYGVCWMDHPDSDWEFVRPNVRQSAQRKAVYRPKILNKGGISRRTSEGYGTRSLLGSDAFSRDGRTTAMPTPSQDGVRAPAPAEGVRQYAMWNSMMPTNGHSKPTNSVAMPRSARSRSYRGSLFSTDYGDKNDPTIDLMNAFRNVFSLSQFRPPPQPASYENANAPRFPHDCLGDYPHLPLGRRTAQARGGSGSASSNQDDASRRLAMLMRIKSQMQCEKSKPLQQTVLDEVQLLKLLLEAKNRSLNRARAE
ncbi:Eukaryotic translation initiation factor [Babesia bigemina]|uniref:Eukaryotic translation initiation factor n=1 Tax=Babesia bigemina TaxID=5866 RepID=A0A061D8K8_BABBI|nr:Eukaryotic translation initiation factor [Babesia bigemina]CDR97046.1 Eukaryotic translation initiation factor [Babesia bigemina]|eukprot:XP_012769232.1 Eukaryotic translation initiation factor [Babesia bigemina]